LTTSRDEYTNEAGSNQNGKTEVLITNIG